MYMIVWKLYCLNALYSVTEIYVAHFDDLKDIHTYLRSAIEKATLLSYHFLNSMWDKPLYTKIDVELKLILYIPLSMLFRFIFRKSYPNFVPGSRFSHF